MHLMLHTGRMDEADKSYQLWRKEKRDDISNCQACEQHAMGGYYFSKGHYGRGLQVLKPILEGKLTCSDVPAETHELVIPAYMALGRREEARAFADKARRALEGPGKLYQYGTLIAFYAADNRRKAVQLYRNTRRYAEMTANDWAKLHYLVGVQCLLEQEGSGKGRKRKARSSEWDRDWVCSEIERLAKVFDERNRNCHVSRRVEELRIQYAKWKADLAAE
jgi:tetratricopeptide (TPR) repeat protein